MLVRLIDIDMNNYMGVRYPLEFDIYERDNGQEKIFARKDEKLTLGQYEALRSICNENRFFVERD